MRGQVVSERRLLIGLAMPETSQKQLQKEHAHMDHEFSEEDVWEMASFHAASAQAASFYGAAAIRTQQAMELSRKSHLMPRSSSSATLQYSPRQVRPAAAAASAPMEVPSSAGLTKKAAAARACGARSLVMVREKLGDGGGYGGALHDIDEDGDDAAGSTLIPPHLITSRQHPNNTRMVSSVMEGAGRTLKGRDLRNVRNAVWKQTGFFG